MKKITRSLVEGIYSIFVIEARNLFQFLVDSQEKSNFAGG
jgi:hypothetical protein